MAKVMTIILHKPTLNPKLFEKCMELCNQLPGANPAHQMDMIIYNEAVPKLDTDFTPWSRVFRARNAALEKVNLENYDYIFFPDTDAVSYPVNFPTRAIELNPEGITAPIVLIDGSSTFYDYSAFILKGKSDIEPTNRAFVQGRNIGHNPPYWPEGYQPGDLKEMDGVGCVTMVPTWIYKLVKYSDHPAYTDHFPLCQVCRENGKKVICDTASVARHANLPDFGHSWN